MALVVQILLHGSLHELQALEETGGSHYGAILGLGDDSFTVGVVGAVLGGEGGAADDGFRDVEEAVGGRQGRGEVVHKGVHAALLLPVALTSLCASRLHGNIIPLLLLFPLVAVVNVPISRLAAHALGAGRLALHDLGLVSKAESLGVALAQVVGMIAALEDLLVRGVALLDCLVVWSVVGHDSAADIHKELCLGFGEGDDKFFFLLLFDLLLNSRVPMAMVPLVLVFLALLLDLLLRLDLLFFLHVHLHLPLRGRGRRDCNSNGRLCRCGVFNSFI
mmetsp:Transcript_12378/g.22524  ORF Transcript_12378/g.22524 Transcript_12378/m.22524 type:complete len:277 (+) Transcript_12378:1251-2081(+)